MNSIVRGGILLAIVTLVIMFRPVIWSEEDLATKSAHLLDVNPDAVKWNEKDDAYWKAVLTPEEYRVCRKKGTEIAYTGKYNQYNEPGTYFCSNCGSKLFSSEAKFDSGTGWPSFYQPINQSAIAMEEDRVLGMVRTEVHCLRCGAHLGHVFDDGPAPTGKRYCINSVCLLHKK